MSITPYDVKAAVDDLGQAFSQFQEANDRRLKEIKQHKAADTVTEGMVDRLNSHVDHLQRKLEQIHLSVQRSPLAGVSGGLDLAAKAAFSAFVRKGIEAPELKSMSVSTDAEGGYAVPPVLYDQMVIALRDSSPMRQVATIISTESDALEMLVDRDEAQSAWVAETANRNETNNANLGKVRIPVHELYAEPRISQKLLDDAVFDVESWLTAKVAEKMGRMENTAFVSGDGVGKPRGFISYPAGTAWGQIETVKTGVDGAFAVTNPSDALFNLQAAMRSSYLPDAVWMLNRSLLADIRKFKSADGFYLWQPAMEAGRHSSLLGFPVMLAEDMPNRSTGSLSIAFANFKAGYTIVDRTELRLLRDPYTAKPYVKLYASKRVGGDVVNFDAIKLLQFSV